MTYKSSEVFAVRHVLHNLIWDKTEIDDAALSYDIVDTLLAADYISDLPFQKIKEETNA